MYIEHDQEPPAWKKQLKSASTIKNVILNLKIFGKSSIADRLSYLYDIPVDEPYQKPIDLESIKGFALFIMDNVHLSYPDIVVNPDGRIVVEWRLEGRGTLIFEFLSSAHVEYLEVYHEHESASQRQYASGVSLIDNIMDIVRLRPYDVMWQ